MAVNLGDFCSLPLLLSSGLGRIVCRPAGSLAHARSLCAVLHSKHSVPGRNGLLDQWAGCGGLIRCVLQGPLHEGLCTRQDTLSCGKGDGLGIVVVLPLIRKATLYSIFLLSYIKKARGLGGAGPRCIHLSRPKLNILLPLPPESGHYRPTPSQHDS